MKVLHVYSGNLFGGVESILVTLARHRALCPELEPSFALCFEGRLSRELREAGCAPLLLGEARVSRPWTVRRARQRLERELRASRPDAVVCHSAWAHALFAPVARRAGVKTIFWLHDALRGVHWLERWAGRTRPDGAVCNSFHTLGTLPRVFPKVPARVIYCPVSPPVAADRAARAEVRRELGIPEQAVAIIQASRLEKWKGHRTHLRALGALRDLPGWVSLIAGGPQRPHEERYFAELQAFSRELGIADRVRFLGQRSDVPRLLAAADLHLQPNEASEPFGITFVEALYAGLPVVTTRLGGAAEIVTAACGRLVSPGDHTALAAELKALILSDVLRERLGRNGPARARELADPATQLGRFRDFASSLRNG
ncbi:MAG: glycosyltransferase [Oligoflexia bacterium]|nr:glycosyltransferase [Oligoflexia bacterium]